MPDLPTRIQRRRIQGWSMPDNTVCVTRDTRWGNPFTTIWAREEGYARGAQAAELCVKFFGYWLDDIIYAPVADSVERRAWLLKHLPTLAGRNLACYCPLPASGEQDHCHAQILLTLANPPSGKDTPA